MKKNLLLALALAGAVGTSNAQTTLPRAVYSLDFEGATTVADVNATQVGDGELRVSSDANFGTYYQNAPNSASASPGTNHLIVQQSALADAVAKSKDGCISMGFWVNPTVANLQFPDINCYYSVLFTFYNNSSLSATTWPMFSVNCRLWMQINAAGAWDDFGDAENVNGSNLIDVTWLKSVTTHEETAVGDDGEETIVTVNDTIAFDDNWHYVALSFNPNDNTTSLFVDAELKNKWNNKDGFYTTENFFSLLYKYDYLVLGGVAQWGWNDPDPAYAYDDFTVYAGELDADQQALVMKIKRGDVDDDTKLAIAKAAYDATYAEYEDFLTDIGSYEQLSTLVSDSVMVIDADVADLSSVEGYEDGAAKITALIDDVQSIVDKVTSITTTLENEYQFAESTRYPGYDDYMAELDKAAALIENPSSAADAEEAASIISNGKSAYVTSQEMPSDGSGIDVTALVLHPWFCNTDAEPTFSDGTYTFPYETSKSYSVNTTPADANSTGWVNGNTFAADDARVNWTEGRICWNDWHAKTTVGTLDIHQDLTNLPEGYYTVSADWVTSSVNDQHTYATSDGVKKVSPSLTVNGWDSQIWTTLETDKVYVGSDGTLTIGGEGSTTGVAYSGWFCVTNFQLTYYGTDVDLSGDLKEKKASVDELISQLELKGDKSAAQHKADSIAALDDTYKAIAELTALIDEINQTLETEQAFTADEDLRNAATTAESANLQSVYTAGADDIVKALQAETATVEDLPALTELYNAYISYGAAVTSAENWGTDEVAELLATQVAAITANGADTQTLADYKKALMDAMKNSLTDKTASESTPVDATFALANPSFDTEDTTGWTVAEGTPANYYAECEFYNTNFDIYQTISGLPAGYYRFAVQGFYRDGACETAYANATATDEETGEAAPQNVLNAEIYANNGENEIAGDIQSWADFYKKGQSFNGYWSPNESDDTVEEDNILYYCNTMEAASILFAEGMNADGNYVDIYLPEGADLTVGIRKTETITYDWTIFDNFHLYYLGQNTPTAVNGIATASDVINTEYFSADGKRLSAPANGVTILRQKMKDGSVKVVKILK